jgi:hypothetical protein
MPGGERFRGAAGAAGATRHARHATAPQPLRAGDTAAENKGGVIGNEPFAVLVASTSRACGYKEAGDYEFLRRMDASLKTTASHPYKVFIGYDAGDAFFEQHGATIRTKALAADIEVLRVENPRTSDPCHVWNVLFRLAAAQGFNYFFQCGDDIEFRRKGWDARYIEWLRGVQNVGCAAQCSPCGDCAMLAMVSRAHLEIFGGFYPPEYRNWDSDVWLTEVYRHDYPTFEGDGSKGKSRRPRLWLDKGDGGMLNTRTAGSGKGTDRYTIFRPPTPEHRGLVEAGRQKLEALLSDLASSRRYTALPQSPRPPATVPAPASPPATAPTPASPPAPKDPGAPPPTAGSGEPSESGAGGGRQAGEHGMAAARAPPSAVKHPGVRRNARLFSDYRCGLPPAPEARGGFAPLAPAAGRFADYRRRLGCIPLAA